MTVRASVCEFEVLSEPGIAVKVGAIIHRERAVWTYTSWGTFYRALLADFGTEHYHCGEFACGFDQVVNVDTTGGTGSIESGR